MRPEVRAQVIYLRDALVGVPAEAIRTAPLLVGPQDSERDRVAWVIVCGHLMELLGRLLEGQLDELDVGLEILGGNLAARVKSSTPWEWRIWERGPEKGAMVVMTQDTPALPRPGLVLCLMLPTLDPTIQHQVRRALYGLLGVLLGATAPTSELEA